MRRIKALFCLTAIFIAAVCGTVATSVSAEEETVLDVMTNGRIESADVIDSQYGNISLWYTNVGGLDATFETERLYNAAVTGSTGALKHTGQKNLYYRFFQGYDKVIDRDYSLLGYVYTESADVSIQVVLVNMQGVPPYGEREYILKTFPLTQNDWTEIRVPFRFDTASEKLISGETELDYAPAQDYDILNVSFRQTQDTKATVVYDEWSCTYGGTIRDDSVRNYAGQFDGIEDFAALEGNLIQDADMTIAPTYPPSSGKWGTHNISHLVLTEEVHLTGTTAIEATMTDTQDMRYGMPVSVLDGRTMGFSIFAKKDAETTGNFGLKFELTVSGQQADGSYQFAFIGFDQVNLDAENWRELRGTVSCDYDETAKTVSYSVNGATPVVVGAFDTLLSVELRLIAEGAGTCYVDSATCFVEHESKIKYVDAAGEPISGLQLEVKDIFGKIHETVNYDTETGYYCFGKATAPLCVKTTVAGKAVEKVLFAGREDLTVCSPYTPKVTLVDSKEQPIKGAQVKLIAGNGKEIKLTDKDNTGVYTCTETLDEAAYRISVFHANYTFEDANLTVGNSEVKLMGQTAAASTFTATVSLFDKKFNPIKGATVELLENGEVIYTLTEGEDGVYTCEGIDGFSFDVRVTLKGYTFESATLTASNRSITISGEQTKKGGCGASDAAQATLLVTLLSAVLAFGIGRRG